MVTGAYADAAFNPHSFVRAADGTFATFDPAMGGTNSDVINPAGAVVPAIFLRVLPVFLRSFVRDPKGIITIFDAPNVCQTSNGTFATGINPAGLVVGAYMTRIAWLHGFLRSPNGAFTTIDVPGATRAPQADAINPAGAISGIYFRWQRRRYLASCGLPAAALQRTLFQRMVGSVPCDTAINPAGAITGAYGDTTGVSWLPMDPVSQLLHTKADLNQG